MEKVDHGPEVTDEYLEAFRDEYIETLLYSETIDLPEGEDGNVLDSVPEELRAQNGKTFDSFYRADDIDGAGLEDITRECEDFVTANWAILREIDPKKAGEDFAYTRNGHGTGFWDGGYAPEASLSALADASRAYGSQSLYLGDDCKVYIAG